MQTPAVPPPPLDPVAAAATTKPPPPSPTKTYKLAVVAALTALSQEGRRGRPENDLSRNDYNGDLVRGARRGGGGDQDTRCKEE